jgi:hypothetical protein
VSRLRRPGRLSCWQIEEPVHRSPAYRRRSPPPLAGFGIDGRALAASNGALADRAASVSAADDSTSDGRWLPPVAATLTSSSRRSRRRRVRRLRARRGRPVTPEGLTDFGAPPPLPTEPLRVVLDALPDFGVSPPLPSGSSWVPPRPVPPRRPWRAPLPYRQHRVRARGVTRRPAVRRQRVAARGSPASSADAELDVHATPTRVA